MNNSQESWLHLREMEREYRETEAHLSLMLTQHTAKLEAFEYMTRRMEEVGSYIHPAFWDYIGGQTVAEVEASITVALQHTREITMELN